MRKYLLIGLLSSSFSVKGFTLWEWYLSSMNKSTHWIREIRRGECYERLLPEHEAVVRDLQDKLGITRDIELYKLPESERGSRTSLNTLYIDEGLFERFAECPEAVVFVIGHELMHAKQLHTFKHAMLMSGVYSVLAHGYALVHRRYFEKIPLLYVIGAQYYINIKLYPLFNQLVGPYNQQCEFEADRECIERLAHYYDREALIHGAARSLTEAGWFPARYSSYENWIECHPHVRERLRTLGLSKEYSEQEGDKLLLKLQETVRMLIALCAEGVDEQTEHVIAQFKQDIHKGAVLTSVHPDVAECSAEKIERLSLIQSFSAILAYLQQEREEPECLGYFSEEDRSYFRKVRLTPTTKKGIALVGEFAQRVLKDSVDEALDYLDVSKGARELA